MTSSCAFAIIDLCISRLLCLGMCPSCSVCVCVCVCKSAIVSDIRCVYAVLCFLYVSYLFLFFCVIRRRRRFENFNIKAICQEEGEKGRVETNIKIAALRWTITTFPMTSKSFYVLGFRFHFFTHLEFAIILTQILQCVEVPLEPSAQDATIKFL